MQLKLGHIIFKLTFVILLSYHSIVLAGTLLVVNTASDSVSLINDKNYRAIAELPVGFEPHEVVLSPSEQYALVSNHGTLNDSKSNDSLTYLTQIRQVTSQ